MTLRKGCVHVFGSVPVVFSSVTKNKSNSQVADGVCFGSCNH